MITPPDSLRRAEHTARMRVGALAGLAAVVVGLAIEALAPGVGIVVSSLAGLLASLAAVLGHAALARDRAALAASAAEAAASRTASWLAGLLGRRLAVLICAAARQRPAPAADLPAAGLQVAPRLLPRPSFARA